MQEKVDKEILKVQENQEKSDKKIDKKIDEI